MRVNERGTLTMLLPKAIYWYLQATMQLETQQSAKQNQTWVHHAMAGNSQAFGALVQCYQAPVFRLCMRYLDQSEAEDIAQDTFVRAFVHRERYDTTKPLLPWLLTIARRLCIDRIRQKKPSRDVALCEENHECMDQSPEQKAHNQEIGALMQRLIQPLPEGQREALLLCHMEGLTYKEIASTLDVPVGTVMTWLHRARTYLKEKLKQRLEQQ